jgi:hypothetical protein
MFVIGRVSELFMIELFSPVIEEDRYFGKFGWLLLRLSSVDRFGRGQLRHCVRSGIHI